MSEKDDGSKIALSRRKVLGSIGAVGVASAGLGASTMALFNDTEQFENNAFTAGTLNLKLDWTESYHGSVEDSYEDVHHDLQNNPGPIFQLDDVKPGDWGEATISLHVADNPAYMWMGGALTENAENGVTEPESNAQGENDSRGAGSGDNWSGELAEETMARLWYDENGNNELASGGESGPLQVALVTDLSASMDPYIDEVQTALVNFINLLSSPDEGAALSFSSPSPGGYDYYVDQGLTTNYTALKTAVQDYSPGASYNETGDAMNAAVNMLVGDHSPPNEVMILLTDSLPHSKAEVEAAANYAKNNGIRLITIALETGTNVENFYGSIASSPDDAYETTAGNLSTVYENIAWSVMGEEVIAQGSLKEVLTSIHGGEALDGDRSTNTRDCYPDNKTQYIGFEWWLPESVGNEVQSDSIMYDLKFYAEQCRHNDGQNSNPFGSSD